MSVFGSDAFGSRRVNGRFVNPGGDDTQGWGAVLKWMFQREQGDWEDAGMRPAFAQPPPERVDSPRIRLTFINHSTVLIQSGGINILTDPIFAERASPLSFAGPKRVRPPGIRFEDLPPIDFVLLSHNHYDHMCRQTLKALAERGGVPVITPIGNADVPRSAGLGPITELDWWASTHPAAGLEVTCVPARHFSSRGPFDRGKALWSGFYLRMEAGTIYFAGDTAWGGFFEAIRGRLGAPDVSLIPIGAYRPRFIMGPVHVTPAEAVRIHRTVGSKQSMAIHFGTFPLADDGQFEPIEDLRVALDEAGVPRDEFRVPDFGEGWEVGE